MKSIKKLLLLALSASLLVGCVAELNVIPVENIKVEYGEELKKDILFDKEQSDEGVKVVSINGFDSKVCGEQDVTVLFSDAKDKKEKEVTIKITVSDTKKPEITLAKEKVEIEEGEELDLKKLVKNVKDPIDGDLTYSKEKVDQNTWYIENVDLSKAGNYKVKVVAVDNNKNQVEKVIEVVVKEKPAPKVEEKVEETKPVEQEQTQQPQEEQVAVPETQKEETKPQQNEETKPVEEEKEEQNESTVIFNNQSLQNQTNKILSSILTDGMNDTQRLYAIYKWVEANIYYDGNFAKADWETMADTALKRRRGNCYAFYAASRALLTAAGYQSDLASFPAEAHVWNRVYLNGAWYHFDTTTGWGGERFLLTDDELRAYRYGDLYYVW